MTDPDRSLPRTIAALRAAMADVLRAHLPDPDADTEARDLLASLHDAPRSWATLHATRPVTAAESARALDAARARARGMPLAYAAGRAAFRHLTLALATERPDLVVHATDLSADALDVAQANARALGVAAPRLVVHHGDLCAPLAGLALDALVSNPPYVPLDAAPALDAGVRDWEPSLALYGGADGTRVAARLVREAAAVVRPGGWLLVEIDAAGGDAALAACAAGAWRDASVEPDLFGRPRFLVTRRR